MSREELAIEFLQKVGFEEDFVCMHSLRQAALNTISEMKAKLLVAFPPSFIGILHEIDADCNNRKITSLIRRMGAVGGYAVIPKKVQKRQGKKVKTLYEYRLVPAAAKYARSCTSPELGIQTI